MPEACSGTQASDRFGITLDFVTKLHNGSISEEEAKRFLRRENPFVPPEKVAEPPVLTLTVLATTNLGATGEKPTSKCFVGGIWSKNWRDNNIDRWLRKNQLATGPCAISTVGMSQAWVFLEAVHKLPGIDPNENDLVKVGNRLIELGYTTTCTQAQEMAERTERGEKTKMRGDGYGNFYLVETGDPENPVSVGSVYRDGDWDSDVRRLGHGYRWDAGLVLLVRNLDA